MPDLLIAPELRDAVRDLILRGRFPDDPANNVLGAVVQLNSLAPVEQPAAPAAVPAEKPKRQRGRPRRGLAAAPPLPAAPASEAEGAD
jgi:hypothetical protein